MAGFAQRNENVRIELLPGVTKDWAVCDISRYWITESPWKNTITDTLRPNLILIVPVLQPSPVHFLARYFLTCHCKCYIRVSSYDHTLSMFENFHDTMVIGLGGVQFTLYKW